MSRKDAFLWTPEDLAKFISQCVRCKHKHAGAGTCDAFPKGIPMTILTNERDHRKPVKGDNGIMFESRR